VPTDFIDIKRQHSLTEIVNRYLETRKKGKDQVGLCPFHDDGRKPSFTIFRGKDGIERYRCFGCEANGDVIDFIQAMHGCNAPEAARILTGESEKVRVPAAPDTRRLAKPAPSERGLWEPIMPVPAKAPPYKLKDTYNTDARQSKDWSATARRCDPYLDESGRLMFWVVRLEFKDGGKGCPVVTYCRHRDTGEERWVAKKPDGKLPVQGLHLIASNPNKPALVVSGEKCFAKGSKMANKFNVISWVGGDQGIDSTDWNPVSVAPLVMFYPDRDESSRKSMKRIGQLLEQLERERQDLVIR
jgi:hypothetical protein